MSDERMFTQTELDQIVSDRLKRERRSTSRKRPSARRNWTGVNAC